MLDITMHSDSELSLLVFNDEDLYRIRHRKNFIETLRELFLFTNEQLDELKQDLNDDLEEIERRENL